MFLDEFFFCNLDSVPNRRVDVRTVKVSDLWRDEERQANQVPRGQLQQESQRAILEGICPNSAEQSRSPGGEEEKR